MVAFLSSIFFLLMSEVACGESSWSSAVFAFVVAQSALRQQLPLEERLHHEADRRAAVREQMKRMREEHEMQTHRFQPETNVNPQFFDPTRYKPPQVKPSRCCLPFSSLVWGHVISLTFSSTIISQVLVCVLCVCACMCICFVFVLCFVCVCLFLFLFLCFVFLFAFLCLF